MHLESSTRPNACATPDECYQEHAQWDCTSVLALQAMQLMGRERCVRRVAIRHRVRQYSPFRSVHPHTVLLHQPSKPQDGVALSQRRIASRPPSAGCVSLAPEAPRRSQGVGNIRYWLTSAQAGRCRARMQRDNTRTNIAPALNPKGAIFFLLTIDSGRPPLRLEVGLASFKRLSVYS